MLHVLNQLFVFDIINALSLLQYNSAIKPSTMFFTSLVFLLDKNQFININREAFLVGCLMLNYVLAVLVGVY